VAVGPDIDTAVTRVSGGVMSALVSSTCTAVVVRARPAASRAKP
jgi:hypothetical protein